MRPLLVLLATMFVVSCDLDLEMDLDLSAEVCEMLNPYCDAGMQQSFPVPRNEGEPCNPFDQCGSPYTCVCSVCVDMDDFAAFTGY